MDDIALLLALPPEAESPDAARAEALVALEASFHGSAGGALARPARGRRRGLFALAGTGAVAALAAGVLVVSSGPSAEPAAASVLHHTAGIAATASDQTGMPGPGQLAYTKVERSEPQEWVPGGSVASQGGVIPPLKGAFHSVDTWEEEEWQGTTGTERSRWVMATPKFSSGAERTRWEAAGSPSPLEASRSGFPGAKILELSPGVMDVEYKEGGKLVDLSALPTEAKALRLALEAGEARGLSGGPETFGGSITIGQVTSELWFILDQPDATPALRAAVFGALAEVPGIEIDSDATDLVGRSGTAISLEGTESNKYGSFGPGLRVEYIFDPQTSEVLGSREIITDPAKAAQLGISVGTAIREVAYLGSGIVDSTQERPGERDGEPVATTSPVQRR
jgi:hypothetical protein